MACWQLALSDRSFDEVAKAHRRLEAGGLEGKLVLCPDLPSRRVPPRRETATADFGPVAAKDRVRRMFMHIINDAALDALGASSKMNNERAFLDHLRKIGWSAAEHWLAANLRFIGERSTVDLSGLLPLQDGLFTDPIGIRQRLQTSDQAALSP